MQVNKNKILHIADIHLEREFGSDVFQKSEVRKSDLWSTFENTLKFSGENNVDTVFISGDLYENENMTISNLERLSYILSKFKDIKFYIAMGNHDCICKKTGYFESIAPENVKIFDNELEFFETDTNMRVYGYSWAKKVYKKREFEIPKLDKNFFNVLLLHGTNEKMSEYLPIDIDEFEEAGFDYIALGHIHKRMKVGKVSYYPGSLEPLDFSETGNHGGILIERFEKEIDVKFEDFSKSRYIINEIDISNMMNNRDLFRFSEDSISAFSEDDFIKLKLRGIKNENISIEELSDYLNLYYKNIYIVDETDNYFNIEKIAKSGDDLISKYFRYICESENYTQKEKRELINIGVRVFLENGDEN